MEITQKQPVNGELWRKTRARIQAEFDLFNTGKIMSIQGKGKPLTQAFAEIDSDRIPVTLPDSTFITTYYHSTPTQVTEAFTGVRPLDKAGKRERHFHILLASVATWRSSTKPHESMLVRDCVCAGLFYWFAPHDDNLYRITASGLAVLDVGASHDRRAKALVDGLVNDKARERIMEETCSLMFGIAPDFAANIMEKTRENTDGSV